MKKILMLAMLTSLLFSCGTDSIPPPNQVKQGGPQKERVTNPASPTAQALEADEVAITVETTIHFMPEYQFKGYEIAGQFKDETTLVEISPTEFKFGYVEDNIAWVHQKAIDPHAWERIQMKVFKQSNVIVSIEENGKINYIKYGSRKYTNSPKQTSYSSNVPEGLYSLKYLEVNTVEVQSGQHLNGIIKTHNTMYPHQSVNLTDVKFINNLSSRTAKNLQVGQIIYLWED